MLFVSLIQWWYGIGWKQCAGRISMRIEGTMDYFSISLLLKTLFQPYRQISAGPAGGSIDDKLRAFADKIISRLIGAMIRLVIILVGIVTIFLHILLGLLMLMGWALLPALPVLSVVALVFGVGV